MQASPGRAVAKEDASAPLADSVSVIFSIMAGINAGSNRALDVFSARKVQLKGRGASRKTIEEMRKELGEDRRTSAQNKFNGYLKSLEVALRVFEKSASEKGFTPEETRAIRTRMEQEVKWLEAEYVGIINKGIKGAESAESMEELDAAFEGTASALLHLNDTDVIHGPRLLEWKLQCEMERDPMAEWGLSDRFVLPGVYRVTDMHAGGLATFSFRLDKPQSPEFVLNALSHQVGNMLQKDFRRPRAKPLEPEALKELEAEYGVGMLLPGLSVTLMVKGDSVPKRISVWVTYSSKGTRRAALKKIGDIVRKRMSMHENSAVTPRAEIESA